ncbi:MAG: xylan esterase, partial [Phycisphaerae bacterium]|nr:xylan esterase [Phycisphaerae bacterium]
MVVSGGVMSASNPPDLTVLPKTLDAGPPGDMMKRHLLKQIQAACGTWRKRYEQLKSPKQIVEYQKRQKAFFEKQLGAWPKRTPLNAQVVGKIQRPGFTVEKIIFESQPKHYVTAAMFLPDPKKHKPPYPGVLVPCGHSALGKGCDLYQRAGALLALNGMAALVFDPIDQGERGQLLDSKGRPPFWGTKAHTMVGVGSTLLGRNTAWFEIWDGMRAIDYLQSRREVDPKRIGCT